MKAGLFLVLILYCGIMYAMDEFVDSVADTLHIETKRRYIRLYEQYNRQGLPSKLPTIDLPSLKFNLYILDYQNITDSDIYQISHDIYEKYYRQDLLLWNYKDSVYLNMNLSSLQSSRGLLKLEIPLSNYSHFLKRKPQNQKPPN